MSDAQGAARRFKVVITDFDYGDTDIERAILEPIGAEVVALQARREDDLLADAADCDAIMNQYARVGARTIAAMTRCRVIARYGIGVDIVDVDAATARNIQVTNVRDYCTEEVADHAVALWMALARKLFQYDRATHEGIWRWQSGAPVHRLRGQTMGIVSFGKIGQAIGARARAFGVERIVYDPYLPDAAIAEHGAVKVGKDELLARADVIMMQVPMTAETRHFLGSREFGLMKPGVIIVNTGRGPTIDNAALHAALLEGRVAGAGLDDPEEEPAKRASWNPADNPLFSHPAVIVTPHAAYYSEQSIRLAREIAASEVRRVLTDERPLNPVNTVASGGVSLALA
ncbi:C-terminal binding protein [Labrys wisconsinensis]|uniref:D-3-phosphoglycerate dehydrogenase n=1 Tax=Labrys wisconsinensis TaxID=425677 RepID=A0ABU0J3U7_9HYPH|nr:C-terminal binding protein [Labrys wisconsinensis]MDQ0468935.1 D-3-phosphoglycerate dehydrogenase [Labrys wisconsinensis]